MAAPRRGGSGGRVGVVHRCEGGPLPLPGRQLEELRVVDPAPGIGGGDLGRRSTALPHTPPPLYTPFVGDSKKRNTGTR